MVTVVCLLPLSNLIQPLIPWYNPFGDTFQLQIITVHPVIPGAASQGCYNQDPSWRNGVMNGRLIQVATEGPHRWGEDTSVMFWVSLRDNSCSFNGDWALSVSSVQLGYSPRGYPATLSYCQYESRYDNALFLLSQDCVVIKPVSPRLYTAECNCRNILKW